MTRLGKFEIKEQLGHGGMGVVYRAWDSKMERWVALKTIAQDKATRGEFIKRFRREALSAGRLDHRNIVTIYEFDEQDDVCYIAMQFLEGSDLETLLNSPRWEKEFTVFRKLEIIIQICQGLAYAHRNGVIHRDVKPANMMILADGTPKIVDFGIARIGEATSGTQNMLLGTAPYMAPEQVEGKLVDERVDIFAVGVIGYRMFTRRFPFEAPNLSSILYKIVHDPPPPLSTYLSDYPADLERILFTALAKDRDQRYPTMEEMAFELQSLLSSLNTSLVSSYMDEAKRLVLLHDFTRAKELLRKVLELEPSNSTATAMWQQVQKLLQQEYTKRKVQALLSEGIESFERGDWLRALNCFEVGLQLDPAHEMLQTYRNLTLREKEKIEAISQDMNGARECLQRRDWAGAREYLLKVQDLSPENADAKAMLAEVDAELAEIEKRRNAQEYLDRAQNARATGQFGDALSLLDKAQALDPENPEANRLRSAVLAEQAEAEQQKVRAERIAAVQAALDRGDYATAVQQAEVGLRAFPNDAALQQLQVRANQGLELARRKKQLAEQVELARTLIERSDLAGARKILAALRERDPMDSRVQALSQAVAKLEERLDRERLRDEEIERARALMRENRHDEARRVLTEARDRFGRSEPLQQLLTFITDEAKRLEQEREIQEVLRQSAELVEKEAFDKAASLIKKAARKHKVPAIADELARVTRLARDVEEQRLYADRVRALVGKKLWTQALNLLGEAPELYRRLPWYKELWQAASSGAGGGTAGGQDEIPTGVIPKPKAAPPPSFAGTSAAPARAPERPRPAGPGVPLPSARPAPPAASLLERLRERIEELPFPPRKLAYAAGTLILIVIIAVVTVGRLSRRAMAPPAVAVPSGTVRLEIVPWAELKEVREQKSGRLLEGVSGQTPLELSLPAGSYRLVLTHPKLGEMAIPVRVEAGASVSIRQTLPKFDPEQVLKAYE